MTKFINIFLYDDSFEIPGPRGPPGGNMRGPPPPGMMGGPMGGPDPRMMGPGGPMGPGPGPNMNMGPGMYGGPGGNDMMGPNGPMSSPVNNSMNSPMGKSVFFSFEIIHVNYKCIYNQLLYVLSNVFIKNYFQICRSWRTQWNHCTRHGQPESNGHLRT